MEAAIIIVAIFSVPLTAIISSTWLKAKKIDADLGGNDRLKRLEQENIDLRRRLEVLESIAIDSRGLPDVRRDGIVASRSLDRIATASPAVPTNERSDVVVAVGAEEPVIRR
jgi:hypothetical protein